MSTEVRLLKRLSKKKGNRRPEFKTRSIKFVFLMTNAPGKRIHSAAYLSPMGKESDRQFLNFGKANILEEEKT